MPKFRFMPLSIIVITCGSEIHVQRHNYCLVVKMEMQKALINVAHGWIETILALDLVNWLLQIRFKLMHNKNEIRKKTKKNF